MLVLGAAAGLERFYYYAWDNDFYGMVTRTGDRLPGYAAMARVQGWLIGARLMGCSAIAPGLVGCLGEIDGNKFLIVWSDRPGDQAVKLPVGFSASGIETLYSNEPIPKFSVGSGKIRLMLGMAPVRISLNKIPQP